MDETSHVSPRPARPSLALAAMQAMTIVALGVAILVTRADADLWGHVRFGTDILWNRALPAVDPFSFTSDRLWVNHEWLSEVALAAAYAIGGGHGLIALKALLVVTAGACLIAVAWQEGTRGRPIMIMGVLTVVGMLPRASQIRPQLISVVCFAVLLNVLRRAGRGQTRALVVIPPLFVLWANAHGGWLVGCATVWAWSLGRLLERWREPAARWISPIVVSIAATLATLATPYGIRLWSFLAETVGPSRAFIPEWGPITSEPLLIGPWLLFWVVLILAIRHAGMPANRAEALIPIALGFASARVSRLDTFFELSVLGFLSGPIAQVLIRRRSGRRSLPFSSPWHVAAVLPVMALALAPAWRSLTCIEVDPSMPEADAIQMVQNGGLRGRMITFFDWGEFAIWYLPPGLRISMDGRRETVYSQKTVDQHLDLYRGTDAGLAYLRQLNPDYAWLPNQSPMVRILVRDGWTTLYIGGISTILARRPIPVSAVGAKTSGLTTTPSPYRCFPGP